MKLQTFELIVAFKQFRNNLFFIDWSSNIVSVVTSFWFHAICWQVVTNCRIHGWQRRNVSSLGSSICSVVGHCHNRWSSLGRYRFTHVQLLVKDLKLTSVNINLLLISFLLTMQKSPIREISPFFPEYNVKHPRKRAA